MSLLGKTQSQDGRNLESMRMLFVTCTRVTTLNSCYNLALVLHENALVFSRSESRNFFMYNINK